MVAFALTGISRLGDEDEPEGASDRKEGWNRFHDDLHAA